MAVEYGANSVRYGSDAMGGVVLVQPRPVREQAGYGGELNLAGFSNGRTGVFSTYLEGRLDGKLPLGGRLQGTLKRSGNLRTPDYFLENTGVREMNYSAALDLPGKRWHSELFFSQFFTDLGIFRGAHIGNLTDLQNAIERGRPLSDGQFSFDLDRPLQRVAHYLLKAKTVRTTEKHGRLALQYARQFNRRQEFDAHKRFGAVPEGTEQPDMMFEITTHTLDFTWEHRPWRHISGSAGLQGMTQRNTTDRGGLIPDYNSHTAGIFLTERWRKYPFPLELEAGVRYDLRRLFAERRGNDLIDRSLDFSNLSGTAGAIWHLTDEWRLRFHAGSAWRSPGVNELYSEGVHHGSASFEKGNEDLVPERAYNLNLSMEFNRAQTLSASLALYHNQVRNFIYLRPEPNPVLTIRGAFPAFAYAQTDARLSGFDWNGEWRPLKQLVIASAASVLRAWDQGAGDWLILMPADRLRQSVQYQSPLKGISDMEQWPFVKLSIEHVFRQKRVPQIRDFAVPPAAFTLIGLEGGATLFIHGKPLRFGILINNLLNEAYRDYLNRLRYFSDEAGRNASVWLKFNF